MKYFAYIKNGTVFLDTGRSEEAFGKSNLAVSLNRDAGFFVKFMAQDEAVSNQGSGEKIECFPWKFSQIQSDADGTVVLSGKLNESACLDNGFEEAELLPVDCAFGDAGTGRKAILSVIKAAGGLLKSDAGFDFAAVGAGGIFAGNGWVLFLPKGIFETCLNSLPLEQQAEKNGCYIFMGLTGKNSLCFLRSVLAYRLLCGRLPFEQKNEEKRQNDILDSLFLPVEFAVNGVDLTLAKAVDSALLPKVDSSDSLQSEFPLEILEKELDRLSNGSRNSDASEVSCKKSGLLSDEEFKVASEKFFRSYVRKVKFIRFVKRNKFSLIALAVCLLVASSFVGTTLKRLANLPTTEGLTAFETVQQFYSGIHNLDAELLMETGKGSDVKGIINVVSAMFVTNKTREGYSANKTFSPERWLCVEPVSNPGKMPWIYGLSNAEAMESLGGSSAKVVDLHPQVFKRFEKKNALPEGEGLLQNGDKTEFSVRYYRIFTQGDDSVVTVEKVADSVETSFKKDRWVVERIDSQVLETSEFALKDLTLRYSELFEKCGRNHEETARLMRAEFSWLPDVLQVEEERARLMQDIANFNF